MVGDGRNVTSHNGNMRYADCQSSFKCINGQCPFRVQFGLTNIKQFKVGSRSQEACSICGDASQFVIRRVRRYVKDGKKGVQVFHCGSHCCPITSRPEKPIERVKEMIKKHPRLKPVEINLPLLSHRCGRGKTGTKWKKKQHSCWTENGSSIRNKVCAKKFIQMVKILKP